jgi:hypothetical protein
MCMINEISILSAKWRLLGSCNVLYNRCSRDCVATGKLAHCMSGDRYKAVGIAYWVLAIARSSSKILLIVSKHLEKSEILALLYRLLIQGRVLDYGEPDYSEG